MHRLILLLCVAGLVLPGTASARVGPCLKPADAAYCDITTGKVTYISDGDTFYVDLNGDRSRRTYPVRITGINAMEQTTYSRTASRRRGECHSLEATSRLEQLLRRSRMRVRLMALDPASRSNVRLRRAVAVRSKGRWVDVGRRLMAEGHALWLPNKLEYAWNADYGRQAAYAASKLRGIWNPRYCGLGPSDESPVRVSVNYDSRLAGGEWIRVHNLDPVNAIPLGGWWLRDGALNRFHFPDWATLPPGERLTVYLGEGIDTWTEFFWKGRSQIFDNPTVDNTGDGAYLFDPQGDLRAYMTYPCARDCTDPYAGALEVTAKPKGTEHVTVQNVAAYTVDLDGYKLSSPPFGYAFGRDAVLNPGESMRINVIGDPAEDTRLEKNWGEVGPILRNGGDEVSLTSLRGIVLDCYAFGSGAC